MQFYAMIENPGLQAFCNAVQRTYGYSMSVQYSTSIIILVYSYVTLRLTYYMSAPILYSLDGKTIYST